MVAALIADCPGRLPFPVSCPLFPYWCFLGSHSRKNYCHIFIHELIMTRGMENSDWVYQGFMPDSLTQAWWRPHLKHMDHRWRRSCFPKEILGIIIHIRKSRF